MKTLLLWKLARVVLLFVENPIGEHDFAKNFLGQKFNSIGSAIKKSFSMLVRLKDPQPVL
jgi:hypothetical protein